MNIGLMLKSGLKAGIITLLAVVATVLAGALTFAMGYRPEEALNQVIMTYVITPLLGGIIGLINNYLKHKDDVVEKKAVIK